MNRLRWIQKLDEIKFDPMHKWVKDDGPKFCAVNEWNRQVHKRPRFWWLRNIQYWMDRKFGLLRRLFWDN